MRMLAGVRVLEWLVLAVTVTVAVWSWLTFVVADPQDWDSWGLVFCWSLVAGATLQAILVLYGRPRGSLRSRLSFRSVQGTLAGGWILLLAPPVLVGVALVVLTPPGTPVDGFDSGMGLYQAVAVVTMLALVMTVLGAGGVFTLVVMPLGFILAAALPSEEETVPSGFGEMSRSQLAIGGLLILATLGFGVSMTGIIESSADSTRERMADQVIALVTGTGDLVATVAALLFVAAIVALLVINRRIESRRRRARDRDGLGHSD